VFNILIIVFLVNNSGVEGVYTIFCSFEPDDPLFEANPPHLFSIDYFAVFCSVLPILLFPGQKAKMVWVAK